MAKPSKYTYYPAATVKSEMDGSVYSFGSTVETLSIEICGNTHPFYTGQQTFVDTAGRIDKFKARAEKVTETGKEKKIRKSNKRKLSIADLATELGAKPESKPAPKKADKVEETKEEVKAVEAPVVEEVAPALEVAEAPVAPEPVVEEVKTEAAPAASKPDDLTKIEGIGPKIAEMLVAGGVDTYLKLSTSEVSAIAEMIKDVRGNHVPDTWPNQAKLAAEGKWEELQKLQDELDGGKA